ncbi:MAG TPA: hypothetical protein VFI70_12200 [Nitrososphaeraceae archaeon]|nr:hypothetical protein [Nitrososphaeraceae archaeon]
MTRGLGQKQQKARLLTNAKIAAYLAIQPFIYQRLQEESRIQKQVLQHRLAELVTQGVVIKHKFSVKNDPNIKYGSRYYLLNWSNSEARKIVEYWFSSDNNGKEKKSALEGWYKGDNMLRLMPPEAKAELQEEEAFSKPESLLDVYDTFNAIDQKTLSDKEHKKWHLVLSLANREEDLIRVRMKQQNHEEELSENLKALLKQIDSCLNIRGYTLLDVMIKFSVDDSMPLLYRYTTIWEVTEKIGLVEKYTK